MVLPPKPKKKSKRQREKEAIAQFCMMLQAIDDPRRAQGRKYSIEAVVMIALMANVAAADNAQEMELWGQLNEEWLNGIVDLPHGPPTQDVFLRVFAALEPQALLDVFLTWMRVVHLRLETVEDKHLAIDGKTLRRSYDKASGKPALHKVSAWSSDAGMVLGQVATDAKSNEITAIPELLKVLDIKDYVITIDSMGCQTKIVKDIKDRGGDYLIAVKGNQKSLHSDIEHHFAMVRSEQMTAPESYDTYEETTQGHGRMIDSIASNRCS